jgi:phospholipase/carboxylesterase
VLQSHGRGDPILPFDLAVRLRDHFRTAGLQVEWLEFNGGHGIPDGVVQAMSRFIASCF